MQRLRIECDEPLSNFAFNFNLRPYSVARAEVLQQLANKIESSIIMLEHGGDDDEADVDGDGDDQYAAAPSSADAEPAGTSSAVALSAAAAAAVAAARSTSQAPPDPTGTAGGTGRPQVGPDRHSPLRHQTHCSRPSLFCSDGIM